MEKDIKSIISTDIVQHPQTPILIEDVFSERNLANISVTVSIDISIKPGVVENIQLGQSYSLAEIEAYTALFKEFRDVFSWTYEEMPVIDPSITVHEIKTYDDAKPI